MTTPSITRKHTEVILSFPQVSPAYRDIIIHAGDAFSFIVPYNEQWSFTKWADEIEQVYDNARVGYIANILRLVR